VRYCSIHTFFCMHCLVCYKRITCILTGKIQRNVHVYVYYRYTIMRYTHTPRRVRALHQLLYALSGTLCLLHAVYRSYTLCTTVVFIICNSTFVCINTPEAPWTTCDPTFFTYILCYSLFLIINNNVFLGKVISTHPVSVKV
jgi:hypothetical protein